MQSNTFIQNKAGVYGEDIASVAKYLVRISSDQTKKDVLPFSGLRNL